MKKVAIVTITDNNNFGNRLQNYAMEKVLKNFDIYVNTIWEERNKIRNEIKFIMKKMFSFKVKYKRYCAFCEFTNKYTSPIYLGYNKEMASNYNYILIGSDQIWNFKWQLFRNKFLIEVDKEKLIAYAPSFGVSEVQEQDLEWYKKILNNVKWISTREESGKKIIQKISKRNDTEVLIDPTLLLGEDEWSKIAIKPKWINSKRKFILTYFLGEISKERMSEIQRVANESNCDIINLMNRNTKFYGIGPQEFIYLESKASLICTDSFHSCVFATIFERPFIVFDREDKKEDNMNSRIDTLLSKFNLQNRRFNGEIKKDLLKCDYKEAKKILEKEKEKSFNFLKKALDIE